MAGKVDVRAVSAHVATGEIGVIGYGVEGEVARVILLAIEAPTVRLGASYFAIAGYASLLQLGDVVLHPK